MSKFSDWLQRELKKQKISQVELANMIGVTPAHVSRMLSGDRSASPETLTEIAHALKLPVDLVYQEAGLLPPETEEEKLIKQINKLMERLSEESKKDIYEYARMRRRIDEDKEQYKNSTNHKPRHAGT